MTSVPGLDLLLSVCGLLGLRAMSKLVIFS